MECSNALKAATNIMIELRDTEERYHQLLLISEKYYFKPLLENEYIKKGDVHYHLFYGLIGIRKISQRFLQMINQFLDLPSSSGNYEEVPFDHVEKFKKNCLGLFEIFGKSFLLFKLISTYLTQHNKEKDNLIKDFEVSKKMGHFAYTQKLEVEKNENMQSLAVDVLSIMISPMQRLPRYRMMLKSMCDIHQKHREVIEDYELDFSKISGAYYLMCFVCEYVNKRPMQIQSDEVLKHLLRIDYWAEDWNRKLLLLDTLSQEEKNAFLGESKKIVKAKRKELKSLYKSKIKKDVYLKKQLQEVHEKVGESLKDLESKIRLFKMFKKE